MGLIACRVQMMLEAMDRGVDFTDTLTLGRQKIWISKKQYKILKNNYNINSDVEFDYSKRVYADNILRNWFSIIDLDVLDFSDYENANIIHDMNKAIPDNLNQKYDVIIDGGTLEHVFNFPIAISNCMNMLKENGNLFMFSMANNHCGHGLYQFSPELFFRIFDQVNGFRIQSIVLVSHPFIGAELSERVKCFSITDPAKVGIRGTLVTNDPLGIMVHATKISHKPIFNISPMQSDYSDSWNNSHTNSNQTIKSFKWTISIAIKKVLPSRIFNVLVGFIQNYKYSLSSRHPLLSKWPKKN